MPFPLLGWMAISSGMSLLGNFLMGRPKQEQPRFSEEEITLRAAREKLLAVGKDRGYNPLRKEYNVVGKLARGYREVMTRPDPNIAAAAADMDINRQYSP